jgi:hypothetical protein
MKERGSVKENESTDTQEELWRREALRISLFGRSLLSFQEKVAGRGDYQ